MNPRYGDFEDYVWTGKVQDKQRLDYDRLDLIRIIGDWQRYITKGEFGAMKAKKYADQKKAEVNPTENYVQFLQNTKSSFQEDPDPETLSETETIEDEPAAIIKSCVDPGGPASSISKPSQAKLQLWPRLLCK